MRACLFALFLLVPQEDLARNLIERLGSDDPETRAKAAAELVRLGEKGVPQLRKALEDPDAEVRGRAHEVLKRIARLDSRGFKIFGDRTEAKRNAVARGCGEVRTEDAVLNALKWLSRHQSAEGSWKVQGFVGECQKIADYAKGEKCKPNPGHDDFDSGVTGLAILAFLGSGYSHLSKDTYDGLCFGDVVRKGIQWIMAHQDPNGCLGSRAAQKYMYNHAICTLALAEAYALTGSNLFKAQAQKAVDFTVAAQNPGQGWRYSFRCGDNDTSVTFWSALALRVAWHTGFEVPEATFGGAKAWLDEVTEGTYRRVGYTHRGSGRINFGGRDNFDHHETLTAMGGFLRILMDQSRENAMLGSGMEILLRDKPKWDENAIDFTYWNAGTLAMFQFDGPDGLKWKRWNEEMKNALVPNQRRAADGCRAGSWDPVDHWGGEGGRVYGTALNALTLESYYRYRLVPRP